MRFTRSDKHINVISSKIIQILILQLNVSNSMRCHSRKKNQKPDTAVQGLKRLETQEKSDFLKRVYLLR